MVAGFLISQMNLRSTCRKSKEWWEEVLGKKMTTEWLVVAGLLVALALAVGVLL